jgi:hypothetical protein
MGQFDHAIAELRAGREVEVRPRGSSMRPKVESGARVRLAPVADVTKELKKGDIVLARVRGTVYLHLISALERERVQIANNRGHVNGWTSRELVYGRAIAVDNAR